MILKSNTVSAVECLTFALSLPVIARSFKPLDQVAMAALLARTEQAAANGTFELFKTTA